MSKIVRIERFANERARAWHITVDDAPIVALRAGGVTDNISLSDALDMVAHVCKALGAEVQRCSGE